MRKKKTNQKYLLIKKIIFSLFVSVKLKSFYLYNFLIDPNLIKKSFFDFKHPLNPFFINYFYYLFNNSFKSYKASIFYFYSIFSKLSNVSINYLENLFYNIQNLILDLDFEFYSDYYHLKNKKEIFIKFLTDLFNNQLIPYKNFDIFNTKIDVYNLKDQKKIILLPINYFQKLNSLYILPNEFKNINNLDLKDYINLVNWLLKNKLKLIKIDSLKNKEKFSYLDINSYEQIINSNKNSKTLNLKSILFIILPLFLSITIFLFLVNNFFINNKNTNTSINRNLNKNFYNNKDLHNKNNNNNLYNNNLYSNNFIYSQLDLVKVRTFGGNSYEEFLNIYNFNNYFYLLGITNSFGFGSFDVFTVKLDSNLNYISSYCFGNDFDNVTYKILPYLDKIIFVGYNYNFNSNSYSNSYSDSNFSEACIFKINNEAKIIYQYSLKELYDSQFLDIIKFSYKNTLNDRLLTLGTFLNKKFNVYNSFFLSFVDNNNSIKNQAFKLIYSNFDNQFLFIYLFNQYFILTGNINQNNENIAYLKLDQNLNLLNLNLLRSLKLNYNYHISTINSILKDNFILQIGDIYYQNNLYPFIILIDTNNEKIIKAYYYEILSPLYSKYLNLKFLSIHYFDNYYYILANLFISNLFISNSKDKKYFIIKLNQDFDIVDIRKVNIKSNSNQIYNQIQLNSIFKNILVGKINYENMNYESILIKFSNLFDIVQNNLYNSKDIVNLKAIIAKKDLNISWNDLKIDLIDNDNKINLVKSNLSSLKVDINIYDIK